MKKHLILILLVLPLTLSAQNTTPAAEQDSTQSLLQSVIGWYDENMNYASITALMTVESSFIPFPSEVVIPPAAYVASNPDNSMNIFLVVLFGTIGAILGALINYYLAMWLGRPIIYKFADSRIGRLCLLSSAKIKKAEDYFNDHGKISTFIGRLVPGIRQLISIPAGLARMNIGSFVLYTTLGAGVWNIVLALIGYLAHGQADLIDKYNHELSIAMLVLVGAGIVWLVGKKIYDKRRKTKTDQPA